MISILEYIINNHINNQNDDLSIFDKVFGNNQQWRKLGEDFIHRLLDKRIAENAKKLNTESDVKSFCKDIFERIFEIINADHMLYDKFYQLINYFEDEVLHANDYSAAEQELHKLIINYTLETQKIK